MISETAPRIFPKLGINLEDIKGKKIADPFFEKNSHFAQIWPNVRKKKWPFLAKIAVFGTLRKNGFNKFCKIALKVGPKIVLYDRIVTLPKKFRFWCQITLPPLVVGGDVYFFEKTPPPN